MSVFSAQKASNLFNVQDEASALWIAAQMGHSQVAKELLEAGAEVDAVREVGIMTIIF